MNGFMGSSIHYIGIGEVMQTEVWGICIDLKMALNLHIRLLEIESDSAVAIIRIHSNDQDFHPLASLIDNCRTLMRKSDHCTLYHVHRERNVLIAKNSITSSIKGLFRPKKKSSRGFIYVFSTLILQSTLLLLF